MRRIAVKKSVLGMWIASYLLVLIVPLLVSQLLYWSASSILEKNAESFSNTSLNQAVASLERVSNDIAAVGRELISRKEVESLSYADNELTNVKREKIRDLQKEMLARCAYSQYIQDVYILFSRPEIVTSTKGFYGDFESFDWMLERDYGFLWEDLAAWSTESGTFHLRMLGSEGEAQKLVAHMTTAVTGNVPEVIILFALDINQIRSVLESESENSSRSPRFWAISEDGLLLAPSSSREFARSIPVESLNSNYIYEAEGDEKVVLSTALFQQCGWSIVSATPLKEYTLQLNQIRVWYLAYLGVCVALGILISVFFAKRNYTPVRRLSEMLKQNIAQDPAGGEFAQLEQGLSSLLKKSQDYEKEIDKQKAGLRQAAMTRMLRGSLSSEQAFETACGEYELCFSTKQFAVVGILIRDYQNLFLEGKADDSDETRELVYFVVISVTEELLQEYCDGYMCQTDGSLYAILSPRKPADSEGAAEFVGHIRDICRRAETFIREQLGILLSFYVSDLYSGRKSSVWGIHMAFKEVQWGFEQIEGFGIETVVNSREDMREKTIASPSGHSLPDSDIKRRQFGAAVMAGDFDEVDALYLELRGEGLVQVEKSFATIRVQTIFLLDYLVSNLNAAQLAHCQTEIEQFLARIQDARHADELSEMMHQAAVCIHDAAHLPGTEETPGMGEEIVRYINGHYQEPDISVGSIADHFDVSQSYLLRLFKKSTDGKRGILDYIHQRRVDTAKILLRESDDTVEHIAAAVGYTNALALIRAFKRLEGTTPTAYRKVTAKQEEPQ